MRMGLENPVAVYSICGVRPRKPQSQVGPMRVLDRRANSTHNTSGTGSRQTAINARPSVETVPPLAVTPDNTSPRAELSCALRC